MVKQAALAQVNAQRQHNGKRPLSRTDTQTMAREAQRAHITPLQALQWVLVRASRNFFKAEYADAAPAAAPDLDTQALIARQARAQEAKAAAAVPAIVPDTRPLTVAGQQITGPAWAMSAARQFCAGAPVSLFRIQAACSVLGVSRQALRGEVGQEGQAQQKLVV